MDRDRRIALVFGALTLSGLALLAHDAVFLAGNDASRFAHVQALGDEGHPWIEGSPYAWTVDRVTLGGHQYSNKPPLMAIVGAGVYRLLKGAFGLDFAGREAATIYWLTLLLVGVPTALLAAGFYRATGRLAAATRDRVLATAGLVAGTLLGSYSTSFNNHTVAAALLFFAFWAALAGRGLAAGALLGLSIAVDIVPGAVFVPVLAVLLAPAAGRSGLLRYAAGLAAGAAVFVAANLATVDSVLPPKMVPGAVDASSSFAASVGGVLLPDSWTYPLAVLFGGHGFFSVSPVLLFGVAGLVLACSTGSPWPRRSALAVAAGVGVVVLGHVLLVGSYGGWSYGFRYLIPVMPILMFFAPLALARMRLAVAAPILALSLVLTLLGAYHPWPPGYEQQAEEHPIAKLVTNPVGGNLAAWAEATFPGSAAAARLGALFVSPDPEQRYLYLALFFGSKGDEARVREMARQLREHRHRAAPQARGGPPGPGSAAPRGSSADSQASGPESSALRATNRALQTLPARSAA